MHAVFGKRDGKNRLNRSRNSAWRAIPCFTLRESPVCRSLSRTRPTTSVPTIWRSTLAHLLARAVPNRGHMVDWYCRRHQAWLPCAHILRRLESLTSRIPTQWQWLSKIEARERRIHRLGIFTRQDVKPEQLIAQRNGQPVQQNPSPAVPISNVQGGADDGHVERDTARQTNTAMPSSLMRERETLLTTRRSFLRHGVKKAVYVTPVVLTVRPSQVRAGSVDVDSTCGDVGSPCNIQADCCPTLECIGNPIKRCDNPQ